MDIEFGDNRLPERFWKKVVIYPGSECWLWIGSIADGYGKFRWNGIWLASHRVAYQELIGFIPDGLQLDHVVARGCISRACCNPRHLEPVTHAVNSSRERLTVAGHEVHIDNGRKVGALTGALNRAKTHCPIGHEYSGINLVMLAGGGRGCRTCRVRRTREWRASKSKE
jgi:hypothetical protein